MSDFDSLRLSPYYLNTSRLEALTGVDIPVVAQDSVVRNSGARVAAMRLASKVANDILRSGRIPNLNSEVMARDLDGEGVLGAAWGIFTFRGLSDSLTRENAGKPPKPATFSGTIPLGGSEYLLSGRLSNNHVYSVTSLQPLTGKKRILIAGRFEFNGPSVEVHPYIIGDMFIDLGGAVLMPWSQSVRVYPEQIDAFAKIEGEGATKEDLEALLKISEETVKHAFAEIIGEPFVPKDWGGEKSDLTTSLTIDGERQSAAFIFKGPSLRGELHPSNMGKRGDQLLRAFDEPVELVVVQHCRQIASNVVRLAESLAMDVRRPRRYCILNGADTARILKAYGRL
jgi:hypothetical protein